jgi:transcriptional regulator with XRE-family HTH domain
MSRREHPVAQSAMPLLSRITAKKFTKAEVARRMNVLPQHVTNWLRRGVPPKVLPQIAELCEISTDDYLVEAGLKKPRAPKLTAGEPMGESYKSTPLLDRLERAFFWLTDEQQAEQLRIIETMASANKVIARQIGGKVQPVPDDYVAQHLRHPQYLKRPTDRKKH